MAKQMTQKSVKEFWAGVVDEHQVEMRDALLEAVTAEREGWWGECDGCRKKVKVTLPDIRARTDAVKALHLLGGSLPKTSDDSKAGVGFILERTIVTPGGVTLEEQNGDEL